MFSGGLWKLGSFRAPGRQCDASRRWGCARLPPQPPRRDPQGNAGRVTVGSLPLKRASCVPAPRVPRGGFSCTGDQISPPHIPDMVRIAISQAAFDAIASTMALGMILLASPACAGSRSGTGFHGGFPAFHRSGGRARGFFGGYAYVAVTIAAWVSTGGVTIMAMAAMAMVRQRRGKCRQHQQRLNRRLCPRSRRRRHSAPDHSDELLGPPPRLRSIRRLFRASPSQPLPRLG